MSKRIQIQARPKVKANADQWVESRPEKESKPHQTKPKRLTIDIDPALHTRLKVHCASQGVQINDLLRGLIEGHVGGGGIEMCSARTNLRQDSGVHCAERGPTNSARSF